MRRVYWSITASTQCVRRMTYAAVILMFAIDAMAASYVPARRASRVDPLVALRQD